MDKLSSAEKEEISAFVEAEQQRSSFQQQVHQFTDVCWDKCIAGGKVKATLDRADEACVSNCVDRFVDSSMLIIQVFNQAAAARK
ncbi:hypothetical protein DFJ73DRAFT_850049 [Zopfochytrium polystomum]|nr:hypothetical protein DFJ73DRAFT_850049 [Zopfochytrium polystomum]